MHCTLSHSSHNFFFCYFFLQIWSILIMLMTIMKIILNIFKTYTINISILIIKSILTNFSAAPDTLITIFYITWFLIILTNIQHHPDKYFTPCVQILYIIPINIYTNLIKHPDKYCAHSSHNFTPSCQILHTIFYNI